MKPAADQIAWEQPGDAWWVKPFLTYVRVGHNDKVAAGATGISASVVSHAKADDVNFRNRYTRAKQEGRARPLVLIRSTLEDQAKKGSTWHIAKLWAWADAEGYKDVCAKQRAAEPNKVTVDQQGGIGFMDLIREGTNGGFANNRTDGTDNHGDGADTDAG